MMPTLVGIPGDILLRITSFLYINDALSFSMICRRFHILSTERTFWMAVLEYTSVFKPLSCTSHEDLSTHELAHLRGIALHTMRRERNWGLPLPRIFGPIKYLHCDRPSSFVFQVPGAEFIVMHSADHGLATCWDIVTSRAVASIHVGRWIFGASPAHEERGKCSMALLVGNAVTMDSDVPPSSLIVLSILDYETLPRFEITFHHDLERDCNYRDAFLNSKVVGVLRLFDLTDLTILAFNLRSHKRSLVKSDVAYDAQMGTASLGGDLYIVRDHRDVSYVYCCPNDLLPYADDKPQSFQSFLSCEDAVPRVWKGSDVSFSTRDTWDEVWFEPLGVICSDPAQGVPVVTLHHIFVDDDSVPRAINIRFWSARPVWDNIAASRLSPAHSLNLGGTLRRSRTGRRSLYAYSGAHLLLVVELNGVPALRLVRYSPAMSSSSVHLLELPSSIDFEDIQGMSLDDHRGVVSLVDSSGVISILPYA